MSLRRILPGFTCLESIRITDISDNEEFTAALPLPARGLLACAASLTELGISLINLINFNRDNLGEAPFIIPFEDDLLSAPFLKFVQSQSKLQTLTFNRPQDIFAETGIHEQDDFVWMYIQPVVGYPQLGPATMWFKQNCAPLPEGFPTSTEFAVALLDKKHLRHLRIPANLFDITKDFLLQLHVGTRGIEHPKIGFDYHDVVSSHHRSSAAYPKLSPPAISLFCKLTFYA